MGVTYTFVDGTTAVAAEVNQNFTYAINSSVKMIKLNSFGLTVSSTNILPFSATRWQNSISLTTDAGATNSADPFPENRAAICRENKSKAISVGTAGGIEFTTDSGATWTAASTAAANISGMRCVDFRREGRTYIAGEASSGTGLWYSTDGGDNFTQVGTPASGTFTGVSMHDDTHGLAIDTSHNIWFTVDGTTWTDSTYNADMPSGYGVPTTVDIEVTASGANIGDFIALIVYRNSSGANPSGYISGRGCSGYCTKFTGAANSTASLVHKAADHSYSSATNFYKLTGGAICYAAEYSNAHESSGHTFGGQGVLYVTEDVGVTWYVIPLGPTTVAEESNTTTYLIRGDCICEYDTNKLLISAFQSRLFEIDLGGFA